MITAFALRVGVCSTLILTATAAVDEITAKKIFKGATDTFLAFRKDPASAQPGASEIPKKCWPSALRDLKPVRVYIHMNNVVVVQKVADGKEEGLYIYQPLSSYMPIDGAHGFELTPKPNTAGTYTLGTGVFSYEKLTTNKSVQRTGTSGSAAETNPSPSAAGARR